MKRVRQALTLSAVVGAGLVAASAFAQQPAPNAPSPPPAQAQPQAQSRNDAAPQRRERGPSAEDRAAFFDARIAAIHAGLKLTADQERLWPPVESAVRDMARQMMELRDQRQSQAAPADPVERMARMGEAATRRGQAMSKLAEAARPLYASLSDDQKRRLQTLMRQGGGMMGRDEDGGRHGRHHDRMGRHDWGREDGGMRGPRWRDDEMRGMRDGDRGGRWNDWR